MWELAFVRPIENLDLGPDGYLILAKVADGSEHVAFTARSFAQVLSEMNARDYEPIGGSIDAKTNRWATIWRKQASASEGKKAPSPSPVTAASPVSSPAIAAQPKRRGRPPKLEAAPVKETVAPVEAEVSAPAASEAPKKRGPGRPKKAATLSSASTSAPAPAPSEAPKKRGPGRPKKAR